MGKVWDFVKSAWGSAKVKAAALALGGALVEHYTGAISMLLGS